MPQKADAPLNTCTISEGALSFAFRVIAWCCESRVTYPGTEGLCLGEHCLEEIAVSLPEDAENCSWRTGTCAC